jgi:cation:H+ antiporter
MGAYRGTRRGEAGVVLDLIFVVFGLLGLFFGGEWLVTGASRIARSFGISALVVGLTVVAFGTSTPELLVSLSATLGGTEGISIGNVIGSNIANIGLILGATGLVAPIAVRAVLLRREIPILLVVSVVAYLTLLDGVISRVEGILLVLGLVAFNVMMVVFSRRVLSDPETDVSIEAQEIEAVEDPPIVPSQRPRELLRLVVGLGILLVGAQLTVSGSTSLARNFGVSELVIGITLVAVGTSLPELATSLVAAFREQSDIAIGNVVGSNIYNLMGILGITAVIQPIQLATATFSFNIYDLLQQPFSTEYSPMQYVIRFDGPIMIGFAVLLLPLVLNRVITRRESVMLLVFYSSFIIFTIVR